MGFHAELYGLDLHSPTRETVVGGSAGDIASLTCVKVVGLGDFFPKVEKANGETDKVGGVLVVGVTEGVTGSMWTVGKLTNINTSQWSPGTLRYCDTSGQLNVSPTNTILKAVCLEQHSASGALYVYNTIKMDNLNVSSLNDVGAITPSANDILIWDGTSWSATALSGVGSTIGLSSLANVGALTPSAGDVLIYDGANWSATAVCAIAAYFNISSVADVVGGASADDILTWKASASVWGAGVAAGGGGGGSILFWNDTCGNAPVEEYYNGYKVRTFDASGGQILYGHVVVPSSHKAGDQITLITSFLATATGQTKIIAEVDMVRMGVEAISSTANHYSSTNGLIAVTAANIPYRVAIPLTNAVGVVNAITLSGSDGVILSVGLKSSVDSASCGIRLLPDIMEVDI